MAARPARRQRPATPQAVTTGDLRTQVAIVDTRSGSRFGKSLRYNPDEVVGRKGLSVFDDMLRDEQVRACVDLKVAAVLGPGWNLEAGDETPAAKALADVLSDDLQSLPGPLEDALEGILSAVAYGFALVEQVYAMDDMGRLRLVKLQPIAPHNIMFEQDPYGVVTAIRQSTGAPGDLPPGKFIHFTNQAGRGFANPYGTADLTAAHRAWFHKVHWVQWMSVYGEKLADAPVISRHPRDTAPDKVTSAQTVLENLQARTVLSVPEGWDVSLLADTRQPRSTFIDAIEHFNLAIAKALLIPDKLGIVGGEVQAGSLALSKTQLGAFLFVVELLQRRIEACVNEQLITRMAGFADPATPAPRFKLLPLAQEDRQAIVGAWQQVVAGGMPQVAKDLAHTRALLDYPELHEDELAALMDEARARAEAIAAGGPSDAGGNEDADDEDAEPPSRADLAAPPGGPWRALRPSEARLDLAATRAAFDEPASLVGHVLAEAAGTYATALRDRARRLLDRGRTVTAVRDFAVPFPTAATRAVASALEAGYTRGVRLATADVRAAKRAQLSATASDADSVRLTEARGMSARAAAAFFRAKALYSTGILATDMLAKAHAVLFNALKNPDKPTRVVLLELDELLAPFVPDTDAAGRVVNVPARIENIARTNTAEAVNEGRWATFTDPDVAEFVEALEYSAILDDRVRENHAAWDGVVKPVDWWVGPPDRRPPDGHQCRCLLVPHVTGDAASITPDEDLPTVEVVDPGFK